MADLEHVDSELRAIMRPFADRLEIVDDRAGYLSIETRHRQKNDKRLWFGGVEIKKRYVSYHLMPVYLNPGLLADLSPALRGRMQGKSCFNFTTVDPALFGELEELTRRGYEDYRRSGYVGTEE